MSSINFPYGKSRSSWAVLAVTGSLVAAGLAGCSSSASSPAASSGSGGGGGADNAQCTAVAKAYATFLAGYTPAKGGDWNTLSSSLSTIAGGANAVKSQLGYYISMVVVDASGLENSDGSDNFSSAVTASDLQPFDTDLKALATACGVTLTPPTPE